LPPTYGDFRVDNARAIAVFQVHPFAGALDWMIIREVAREGECRGKESGE